MISMENLSKETARHFDHTLLRVTATVDDIARLCLEAEEMDALVVCVPPCYVKEAKKLLAKTKIKVCTVVSFPDGNAATAVKVFECKNAIKNGADEIDVVINLGYVKKRKYDQIQDELALIRKACKDKIVKLIIEAPLLSPEEQIAICTIAASSKMNYISTCTGFGTVAREEDVERLASNAGEGLKVKAAGGITTATAAEKFLSLGADRVGESIALSVEIN